MLLQLATNVTRALFCKNALKRAPQLKLQLSYIAGQMGLRVQSASEGKAKWADTFSERVLAIAQQWLN